MKFTDFITTGRIDASRRRRRSRRSNTWITIYNKPCLPVTEQLFIDSRTKTIAYGYDAHGCASVASAGRPLPVPVRSLDKKPTSTAILDDTYAYDQNANVASITDGTTSAAGSRTMSYDGLDRLLSTHAAQQAWVNASTTYDALDNIRSNTLGTRIYNYQYDASNRLTQLTRPDTSVAYALSYDARGNLIAKGAGLDAYRFDSANRLTDVTSKESYRYDGQGRRVLSWRATGTDIGVYSQNGQLMYDQDTRNQSLANEYIYLNGSVLATYSHDWTANVYFTRYHHNDALHTPIVDTGGAGNITHVERYTPYGEPGDGIYTQGPGFTGHVTDSITGLTYAQQRYYDPILGRFLSADPVQANGNTGGDFNRYWYANNNPYKFTDPDGRWGCPAGSKPEFCGAGNIASPMNIENAKPEPKPASKNANVGAPSKPSLAQRFKDRSSFTAEGAAAFGPGVEVSGTKEVGHNPDSAKGSFVVGEGAIAAAMYNFNIISAGKGHSGMEFTGDPGSYLKVKLGAVLGLGFEAGFDPAGHFHLSVSVGAAIGEEVIVKPPVTVGVKHDFGG